MRAVTHPDDPGRAAAYWSQARAKELHPSRRVDMVQPDRIIFDSRVVYDGDDDTEANVISCWTRSGPIVLAFESPADATMLVTHLLGVVQRMLRAS